VSLSIFTSSWSCFVVNHLDADERSSPFIASLYLYGRYIHISVIAFCILCHAEIRPGKVCAPNSYSWEGL
jgi:hypothetical protein